MVGWKKSRTQIDRRRDFKVETWTKGGTRIRLIPQALTEVRVRGKWKYKPARGVGWFIEVKSKELGLKEIAVKTKAEGYKKVQHFKSIHDSRPMARVIK